MSIILSILFIYIKHPLRLGLILIFQTIIITIILGITSQTFWFSYILFLVIIGGILIIFIYIISLIFNKIFLQSIDSTPLYIIIFILLIYLFLLFFFKINSIEIFLNYYILNETSINLIKLYNFPINLINLIIISYLFFILIVVVKITNFYYGPLRIKI